MSEQSDRQYARYQKVLVCDHPYVDKIYHLASTKADKNSAIHEFFRIILKGGHVLDFNTLPEVNEYLMENLNPNKQ